jgi:SAM-dependent methyltransferase
MIQIDKNVQTDYYDEYYMTTSFSESMKIYEKELCEKFFKEFSLKNKKLIEIGSGDGQFLKMFSDKGTDVLGFEPSKTFFNLALKRGLKMKNEYFNSNSNINDNFYDAVISRQVFEHLNNPNEVLENIFKKLKFGGVGLIEIPSFEKSLKENRYYDVFLDHKCYYTKKTLSHLLNKNGFEVTNIFNSFNDEYIVAYFRKNMQNDIQQFAENFLDYKSNFKNIINKMTLNSKKIVMYGAGGKGLSVLTMCNIDSSQISYVVDSDLTKQNKYTVGSHILIKPPEILKTDEVDVIIISAMAYYEEILKDLTEKYNYSGEIYAISPNLKRVR